MKSEDTKQESDGKKNETKAAAKKKQTNYKGKKQQLTASQLRNARKRRSKAALTKTTTTPTPPTVASSSSRHHSQQARQQQQQQQQQQQDPSLRYMSNPLQAPIVQKAIRFFASQQPAISQFPVIMSTTICDGDDQTKYSNSQPCNGKGNAAGAVVGWRTVAKLAVRSSKDGRITIGLFAKGSHDVLDCAADCPAHHASINRAVQCLQEICRRRHPDYSSSLRRSAEDDETTEISSTMMIPPYSEQSGHGCFRYVQCQVERATGAVQITLVWRKDARHDAALKFLCREIFLSSLNSSSPGAGKHRHDCSENGGNGTFLLHSLWVHYNNAGKHENSIVSRSAPGVNTLQCHIDKLHEMGQDGSWVHIIPASAADITAAASAARDSAKDDDVNGNANAFLSGGVVVERLDNVLQRRGGHSGNDDDDDDASSDDGSLRHRPAKLLLSVPLHFAPNVFRQANLDGFSAIVTKIRSYFQSYLKNQQPQHSQQTQQQLQRPSIDLVELYGGVGTIGLHLTDLCKSLVCSDENPYNQSCFQAAVRGMKWSSSSSKNSSSSKTNKKHKKHRKNKTADQNNNNPDDAPTMIRYEPQSATAMVQNISLLRDADWIIVDPPRKGLDEAVIQALCRDNHDGPHHVHREHQQQHHQQPKHQQVLVYVSCGFDAFQRDFGQLTTMGTKPWKLKEAEGHILFPGSDAIEVLAFFTR